MMTNNKHSNSTALSDDASSGGGGGSIGGVALKKGPWTATEDSILIEYVNKHGEGNWNAVQKNSGLSRCGKSCRLRWANHLRPNLKKGSFTPDEERLILELHSKLGNKWARMAAQLPGRTDNEIKNYWNTRVKRRQRAGLPLYPNDIHKQGTSTFHHNQSYLSQPPQNSSNFSSQQQKQNFGTPLSLFEPLDLSSATSYPAQQNTNHFLTTPINGFKRFRGDNYGFSHNSFSNSTSLFNQNFSSQLLPPPSSIQFNLGNYDLNPQQTMMQNQYDSTRTLAPDFSTKMELPSNQLSQPASNNADDYQISDSLSIRSNSGLLDALIQEAQAMGNVEDMQREQGLSSEQVDKCMNHDNALVGDVPSNNGTPPLESVGEQEWQHSSPNHSSVGEKRKQPTDNELSSAVEDDDDLSSLLNIIPSTMLVSEFYNDNGEISNGQSSGVTDEDTGLDMQQLPSTINTTTTNTTHTTIPMNHDWTTGGWNNLPEMC